MNEIFNNFLRLESSSTGANEPQEDAKEILPGKGNKKY